MPGPVVHTIISEHLPNAFDNASFGGRNNPNSGWIANQLRNNRTAMTYGAMGPDPFFFNLDDLPFMPSGSAHTIIHLWDQIGRIQLQFHNLVTPLKQVRRQLKNRAQQGITHLNRNSPFFKKVINTLKRLRETSQLVSRVMRMFVKKTVLNNADPFGLYVSPYQECEGAGVKSNGDPETHKDWWWFDTLHTRRTGDFVSQLLDVGRGRSVGKAPSGNLTKNIKPQLLSYAVGYLSHMAADVVGHAYVNTMVGGPYRLTQAQRHTTQEKLMDVWAYQYYYDNPSLPLDLKRLNNNYSNRYYQANQNTGKSEALNSGLHKNQQFTRGNLKPKQFQINHNRLIQRQRLNGPIKSALRLPDEISKNFAFAAEEVYDTTEYGPLTEEEVDLSYRLWYLVLRNSTNTLNVVHPSNLPGGNPINKAIQQQWNKLKQWLQNNFNFNLGGGSGGGGGGGGGGKCGSGKNFAQKVWNCIKSAASSIWNFVTNLAKAIAKFVRIMAGLIRYVFAKIASLPLDFINFLLGRIYEWAYEAYRKLLLLITSLGFGYCYSDQLATDQIEHLLNPRETDHFGRTVKDTIVKPGQATSGYPRVGLKMGHNWKNSKTQQVMQGLKNEGHLVVPASSLGGEIEYPKTIPGPDIYSRNTPEIFITDPGNKLSINPGLIADPPKNRSDTRNPSVVNGEFDITEYRPPGALTQPVLGDAVSLTVELFKRYLNDVDFQGLPNLNMSGDRGIGYPTWANKRNPPCKDIVRHRWSNFHNGTVGWLHGGTSLTTTNPKSDTLEPVFEPDVDDTPPGY